MDYLDEALALYKLTKDPFLLATIKVLGDPDHPNKKMAEDMIDAMVEARSVLFPPE